MSEADVNIRVERKARELNAGLYARAERQDRAVRMLREEAHRQHGRVIARQRVIARLENLHDSRITGAVSDVGMSACIGAGTLLLFIARLLQDVNSTAAVVLSAMAAAVMGAGAVFIVINFRALRRYRKRYHLARLEAARVARFDADEREALGQTDTTARVEAMAARIEPTGGQVAPRGN